MAEELVLDALERTGKAAAERRQGFIPAVIYGEGIEGALAVKFDAKKLRRVLESEHRKSRVKVNIKGEARECIVKEIQRHITNGEISHVDLQVVSGNEIVKMKVPVVYTGRGVLENRSLVLEVFISELELRGRLDKMPEAIEVEVGNKEDGDKITVGDIHLDEEIKVLAEKDEVLAVVAAPREAKAEEQEEEGASPAEAREEA